VSATGRFLRQGWPDRRIAGLALIAGLMAAAGQAPLGWWWLALPGYGLALRLALADPAKAGRILWLAGVAHFAAALSWIVEPFLIEPLVHGWMAPFALAGMAGGMALFWGAAGLVAGRTRTGAAGLVVALTLAEMARGVVLTGFPWALPGHVWIGHAPDQIAALAGQDALTLLTLLVAAGLAAWRPLPVAAAALAVAGAFGFGMWRLSVPEPAPRDVTLRLVQPNAEQHLKWDPERARAYFDRQIALTVAGERPDLTIWPETAVPYILEDYPQVADMIAEAGRGAPVALGVQRVEDRAGGDWQIWNSLVVLGQGAAAGAPAERLAVYDKHHLVPFGEYMPFGDLAYDWFGIRAFAAQVGGGYSAGTGPAILDLGPELGRVLPLICYEAVFPGDIRAAPGRADWMLQITNDAWFGVWTGPFQHFALARLRAVEQGLPLVRVANTGVTAVIDARGRVLAELPMGVADRLDAALPGALPATPYAEWGQIPVLVLLAGLFPLALRRRRSFPA
jgi:apolipoprotein N-acyltransferase